MSRRCINSIRILQGTSVSTGDSQQILNVEDLLKHRHISSGALGIGCHQFLIGTEYLYCMKAFVALHTFELQINKYRI